MMPKRKKNRITGLFSSPKDSCLLRGPWLSFQNMDGDNPVHNWTRFLIHLLSFRIKWNVESFPSDNRICCSSPISRKLHFFSLFQKDGHSEDTGSNEGFFFQLMNSWKKKFLIINALNRTVVGRFDDVFLYQTSSDQSPLPLFYVFVVGWCQNHRCQKALTFGHAR